MSNIPCIEFYVRGLMTQCSAEHRALFSCLDETYLPHRRKKIKTLKLVGVVDDVDPDLIWVPLGLVIHLAKGKHIVPKFLNPEAVSSTASTPSLEEIHELKWRDPQLDAIKAACRSKIGNIVVPMAVGKTAIAAGIAVSNRASGNVLVLVPSRVTLQNFWSFCTTHRVSNVWYSKDLRVQSIPAQGQIIVSLGNDIGDARIEETNPRIWSTVQTLVCDESQNWHKRGWIRVLMGCPRLSKSFSLSATSIQVNEENKPTQSLNYKTAYAIAGSGPVIYRALGKDTQVYIDVPDLYNFQYSWSPENKTLPEDLGEGDDRVSLPWKEYLEALNGNAHRNQTIVQVAQALQRSGRISVIPVSNKAYANWLAQSLDPYKTICWFGGGDIRRANGDPIKPADVAATDGPGLVIIATQHLDEGWSFSSANALLLVSGKEWVAITQRSGRVIRKSDVPPIIINFLDDYNVFRTHALKRSRHLVSYYKQRAKSLWSLDDLEEVLTRG